MQWTNQTSKYLYVSDAKRGKSIANEFQLFFFSWSGWIIGASLQVIREAQLVENHGK